MKLCWFLFANLAAMCLVVAIVLGTGESPTGHGFKHPTLPTMDRGGEGLLRHGELLELGWMFGALQLSFFVGCMAFAAGPRARRGAFGRWLCTGGLLLVAVYTAMFLAYRDAIDNPDPWFIGPFPAATAVMLFGIWWLPVIFVALYVLGFRRWIITTESLAEFNRLLASRPRLPEERA